MSVRLVEENGIKIVFVPFDQPITYSGEQIEPLWTFKRFGVQGDSVLVFRGPLRVEKGELVDLKDLIEEGEKRDVVISSDDAINFVVEHFDEQPPSLRLMYHRLRIFSMIVKETVESVKHVQLRRDGTDLYKDGGKLSVAIATVSPGSGKIHFALNVKSEGAPLGVNVIGLKELGFAEEELKGFAETVARKYRDEILDIEQDLTKTRTF